jgi:hypothetical protein
MVKSFTNRPSPQKSNMVKLPTAPCVCPRLDARTVFSGCLIFGETVCW